MTQRSSTGQPTKIKRWVCVKCGHRNELRGSSRKCQNPECLSPVGRRKKRKPAHAHPLDNGPAYFAALNVTVHGCDQDECAICLKRLGRPGSGQRDHAHFDGGYARGLLCWYCNKRLGEIERGQNGAAWMRSAIQYVERSAKHHARTQ